MHAALFTVAVAAPVMVLASNSVREFQFPDSVPLEKRQTSGPKFECHSACGNTILQSEGTDYCDNTEWTGLLEACLDCALEFEIWQYYSPQVVPAAQACGLDATPKPAGSGGSSDTTSAAAAQSTAQAAASSAAPATEAEPSSEAPAPAASTEAGHSAAATTETDHGHATGVPTTVSTAESKTEETSPAAHESHKSSDVAPPAAETTPVQAGAGALGLSTLAVAAGAVVAMVAHI